MNKNFKNKNKGFTLIELLAVIVILAIIALIAVPQILNILNNVRKNAAIDSANGIIKSAENYVTTFMLQNTGAYPQEGFIFNCENGKCSIKNNLENYNIDNLTELSFKGTKPTSGTVIIDNNGDTSLSLNLNNFCVKKHFDEDTPYIDDIENCEFEQKEQLRYEASILNSSCSTLIGKEWNFEYKGQGEEIILPCDGTYKIELWGAGGGGSNNKREASGDGAYTSGNIKLTKYTDLYIYVGGAGITDIERTNKTTSLGGYNGGETSYSNIYTSVGSGGGATDVRLIGGEWNKFESLKSRIMVAAGGGGQAYWVNVGNIQAGAAGGLIGYEGEQKTVSDTPDTVIKAPATGGTQTSGGLNNKNELTGFFGYSYQQMRSTGVTSTGGGGGYYGGGSGIDQAKAPSAGAGGSSFISGHNGCDAIEESSTEENITHTNQSIHYSGLYFTDTKMIDGKGYQWTDVVGETVVGMPNYSDPTTTMTGNSGNGYARITLLSIN